MISSGMSILRALYVLEEQTESKFLKETIVAVRKDVEAGLSLSAAMERHPKVFSPLFVAMTQAGETGRCARGRAHARRRPAAEGRRAEAPDQIGDDLPDARDHLRGRRDDGAGRLPRARVRGRLQAVRRRTAEAHAGVGVHVTRRHQILVGDVPHRRRSRSPRSSSGRKRPGAGASGITSACTCR